MREYYFHVVLKQAGTDQVLAWGYPPGNPETCGGEVLLIQGVANDLGQRIEASADRGLILSVHKILRDMPSGEMPWDVDTLPDGACYFVLRDHNQLALACSGTFKLCLIVSNSAHCAKTSTDSGIHL